MPLVIRDFLSPEFMLAVSCGAGQIRDALAFDDWAAGPLKSVLPHQALMYSRFAFRPAHGTRVDSRALGVPAFLLPTLLQNSLRGPLVTHLMASGKDHHYFDVPRDGPNVEANWLARFKSAGWFNALVLKHETQTDDQTIQTLVGLCNVPPCIEPQAPHLSAVLLPMLDAVLTRIHADPPLAGILAKDPLATASAPGPSLTHAERDIVALLMQGKSNKEIAKELKKSDLTVKHQLSTLCRKLKARNRVELIVKLASSKDG